ncbi:amidase [Syncephalis pseudoplumigaleata]|uniref:amidase n=1 Tax=Syncephalis pseudoplumigaleata TaxID=1712513 RepID=A0A4P9YVI6_9FUNG|nr:amidase [Syncephalis pseudoplumigaleata]|eukprot:RKP22930.1 amidase [Syncephalis pseudoplumigaleata]
MSARKICAAIAAKQLRAADAVAMLGGRALDTHARTNCLTEVCIAEAIRDAQQLDARMEAQGPVGPLHGLPISIKDNIAMKGYDACIGYSAWTGRPSEEDSVLLRCLRRAGAIPFVKTNVPQTLLAFECDNPVFGRTLNPHDDRWTPGGSSGGEGALIGARSSVLGIGNDIGGSLRIPAHFCGIYSLKPTVDRIPNRGTVGPGPGQALIRATSGPMANDVDSLALFMEALLDQQPWLEDPYCAPLPWRPWSPPEKLCIGYFTFNGFLPAAPPCQRAVMHTVQLLRDAGHDVVEFELPNAHEAAVIFHALMAADGGHGLLRHFDGDPLGPPVQALKTLVSIPRFVRHILSWLVANWYGEPLLSDILSVTSPKSYPEVCDFVVRRDAYRYAFANAMRESAMRQCGQPFDAVICPAFGLPAIPHDSAGDVLLATGYTILHNVLDVPSGIVPAITVDRELDAQVEGVSWLGEGVPIGYTERIFRSYYDVEALHGHPVGVQVFADRFSEERVIGCMKIIDDYLKKARP